MWLHHLQQASVWDSERGGGGGRFLSSGVHGWNLNTFKTSNQVLSFGSLHQKHVSPATFDDLATQSQPQMLLFLILIAHVAVRITYSVSWLNSGEGSVWPSLCKNVFDWADFPLTPPKQLIIRDLPQLSSSPLNLIAIINTTVCTSFVLLSSLAAPVCSLIAVFIAPCRSIQRFQTGGKQEEE